MAGAGTAYPADYSATYNGPTYSATQGRTAMAAAMGGATAARPLGGLSGVRPGTPASIVSATSTTWTVTPFGGYIDLEPLATNGGYLFSFQSTSTGPVTAAVGSARTDILYVQIADVNASDGTTVAPRVILDYVANYPTNPLPARAFILAQINVPASGGGSPTVIWAAPYTTSAGGLGFVNTFSQLPASSVQGTSMYAYDTGVTWRWYDIYNSSTNPSGRKTAGWKPWETAVPVSLPISNITGYNTVAGDNAVLTWSARSGRILVEGRFKIVSGGGLTSSGLGVTAPFALADKYTTDSAWWTLGFGAYLYPSNNKYMFELTNNGTTGATSQAFNVAGTYPSLGGAVSNTVPIAQNPGNVVTFSFEYDPA